jgi:hypothetical protein
MLNLLLDERSGRIQGLKAASTVESENVFKNSWMSWIDFGRDLASSIGKRSAIGAIGMTAPAYNEAASCGGLTKSASVLRTRS